jgi:hypothetical protein
VGKFRKGPDCRGENSSGLRAQSTGHSTQDPELKRKKRAEKIIYFNYKLIILFLPILRKNEI